MQIIKAGGLDIQAVSIFGEHVTHNGAVVDSLRVSFPADVTEEELLALTSHPWEIYGEDGQLQGAQAGVNYVKDYTVTFLKVPDVAKLQAQLEHTAREAAQLRAEADALRAELYVARAAAEEAAALREELQILRPAELEPAELPAR